MHDSEISAPFVIPSRWVKGARRRGTWKITGGRGHLPKRAEISSGWSGTLAHQLRIWNYRLNHGRALVFRARDRRFTGKWSLLWNAIPFVRNQRATPSESKCLNARGWRSLCLGLSFLLFLLLLLLLLFFSFLSFLPPSLSRFSIYSMGQSRSDPAGWSFLYVKTLNRLLCSVLITRRQWQWWLLFAITRDVCDVTIWIRLRAPLKQTATFRNCS